MAGAARKVGATWRLRVATTACALALLAACGGQQWSSSNPAGARKVVPGKVVGNTVVLESVRTTAAARSARFSMNLSMTGLPTSAAVKLTGDGIADFVSGDAQITMHVDTGAFGSIDEVTRVVRHVVYVQIGGRPTWVEVDPTKLAPGAASTGGMGNTDPSQFLASLEGISDSVRVVGPETVRGVTTTQYHAALDLGKAIDRAKVPPALRGATDRIRQSLQALPPIPVDVFVDAQGRLRRMQMTMDLSPLLGRLARGSAPSGFAPKMSMTMDLYDFGVPVDVQAPAPDQISSLRQLGSNGGVSFGSPSAS